MTKIIQNYWWNAQRHEIIKNDANASNAENDAYEKHETEGNNANDDMNILMELCE